MLTKSLLRVSALPPYPVLMPGNHVSQLISQKSQCISLTIDHLAVLEVLLKELDTSIDAVLDLVICVYLDGNIVPERG